MSTEAKPELRPDQVADLGALIHFKKFGLWHDPGGGKTPIASAFTYYCWAVEGWRTAWAMPKSLLKKNRDEILRFSHFEPEDVVIVAGSPTKRKEIMASNAKVFLFTFQGFSSEWDYLMKCHPDFKCNVVDEFHLGYSGHKSNRTQSWYTACREMKAIVPMTGTVIKGKLDSAYPILHAMAPLYYGNYESFLNHHALRGEYGIIGWKNHDRLGLILQAVGVRRSFESIFGKEAKVIQIEKCQMLPKQAEAYLKMEGLGLLELEDSFLKADSKGVQVIRCRQIMAHPETFSLMKEGEMTGKDERLWIHIEDHARSGEQLAIFSSLVPEQERIYKQLLAAGHKAALINGSVSGPKRQQIDEDFRSGKIQFIVGSPATMAVGFNWGMLNTIIFVSLDYGDDSFVQAYRRAIRGKRDTPLLIIVLEYEDSIDQRIFEVVQAKSKDANLIDETKEEIKLGDHKDVVDWLKKGLVK